MVTAVEGLQYNRLEVINNLYFSFYKQPDIQCTMLYLNTTVLLTVDMVFNDSYRFSASMFRPYSLARKVA